MIPVQVMKAAPVARAAARGLIRRRLQTIVTGLVLVISACASVLVWALLVDAKGSAAGIAQGAAAVPVLIAVSVVGLALSLLMVGYAVRGEVAAGHARIGILKRIGFSPGQVIAVYAAQGLVPAAGGCLAGLMLGHVLAGPLLASAAHSFGVGVPSVPAWVNVDVAFAICGLTGIASLVPARRAARVP
jgi:hypothetical protein